VRAALLCPIEPRSLCWGVVQLCGSYSNAPTVELLVNGKSQGERTVIPMVKGPGSYVLRATLLLHRLDFCHLPFRVFVRFRYQQPNLQRTWLSGTRPLLHFSFLFSFSLLFMLFVFFLQFLSHSQLMEVQTTTRTRRKEPFGCGTIQTRHPNSKRN
jgi:hypothetical protein